MGWCTRLLCGWKGRNSYVTFVYIGFSIFSAWIFFAGLKIHIRTDTIPYHENKNNFFSYTFKNAQGLLLNDKVIHNNIYSATEETLQHLNLGFLISLKSYINDLYSI